MKVLDLFCGAGGAGMGYHRAGFEVVGADGCPEVLAGVAYTPDELEPTTPAAAPVVNTSHLIGGQHAPCT